MIGDSKNWKLMAVTARFTNGQKQKMICNTLRAQIELVQGGPVVRHETALNTSLCQHLLNGQNPAAALHGGRDRRL